MEVKKLDGSYMQVEEVNGMLCEVEKKELVGGVFEVGESCFQISFSGDVFQGSVFRCDEYGTAKGLTWKTREEAERKVEIDNLIAKHRITDRKVLEDVESEKHLIYASVKSGVLGLLNYSCNTISYSFTKENALKLIALITYEEWTKYVLLWQ